jgi:uncharacterized membrane protein HdeD (DUF308 family)/predicted flap endonuclease-1-like 5' DNA nuclease
MTATVDRSDRWSPMVPWWLVLIEGILAIIVGILLWMYPVRAFITLSVFIGFYWIISGMFDIGSIFFNRTGWGWKLFMGVIGIIAGGYLVSQVIAGAVTLAITAVWIIGLGGLFYGLLGIIRAFQGAGWGAGILGAVSIFFGLYILANRFAAALAIPWVFGFLGIFGGILAIFAAFALRSAAKRRKSVLTQARVTPTPAVAERGVEVSAAPVPAEAAAEAPAVAAAVAAAGAAAGAAAVAAVTSTADETTPGGVAARVESVTDAGPAALVGTAASEIVVAEEVVASAEALPGEAAVVVDESPSLAAASAVGIVSEKAPESVEAVEMPAGALETPISEMVEATEEPGSAVEVSENVEIPDVVDIPEEQARTLKHEIEYVEGIGPVFGAKLKAVGINTPLDLLRKGATRKGRDLIAEATGITLTLILKWVNHTDLYRLKGVGSEYADLLEAAGVDTVVELATRNPTNLHNKLVVINEEKKLVRQVPSATQVENWVVEAKQLGRVVTY